jgi:glycerophosphoryl diester phosphodiesterase
MNILLDRAARPVIGHRGAAAYAPENTLASFRRADALEFDVRRAADGIPVVHHDPTLDRTTDRGGPVASLTSAELAQVDAGYQFRGEGPEPGHRFRGGGVNVPTLREVVLAFPVTPLLIEIKEREVQDAVARVLVECDAVDRAVVAGNDWRALTAFAGPPFNLGASPCPAAGLSAPPRGARAPCMSGPWTTRPPHFVSGRTASTAS